VSVNFTDLRRFKQLGLPYSAVLVKLYLDEHGFTPIGTIADACGVSVSSVEKALKRLKALRLLSSQQKITHDHDHSDHVNKGTEQTFTAQTVKDDDRQLRQEDDPLKAKLLSYDVLPWCADMVAGKIASGELRQAEVQQQLDYHEHRLQTGFKFRTHPARYLFSAILKGYAPPEGYYKRRHNAQEAPLIAPKVLEHPPGEVKAAADQPATPEQKLSTLNDMLSSPVPGMRRLAAKLARDWGIELPQAQ
jgi:hypothetical protein